MTHTRGTNSLPVKCKNQLYTTYSSCRKHVHRFILSQTFSRIT